MAFKPVGYHRLARSILLPDSVPTLRESTSPPHSWPEGIVVEPGFFARYWWFIRRAFVAAYEDNCFSIAKGAAYSSLLSLFPILTTLTAILLEVNAQSVVHIIATFAREVVPPGAEELVLSRLREHNARPISLTVFAVLLSLWAGSGAMITLMEGFQAAYRIPSGRPFLKQRAMAIFLVLIAAFPRRRRLFVDPLWKSHRTRLHPLDWRFGTQRTRRAHLACRALSTCFLHDHFRHRPALLLRTKLPARASAAAQRHNFQVFARMAGGFSGHHCLVVQHDRFRGLCTSCQLQPVLRQSRNRSRTAHLALSRLVHRSARLRVQRRARTCRLPPHGTLIRLRNSVSSSQRALYLNLGPNDSGSCSRCRSTYGMTGSING